MGVIGQQLKENETNLNNTELQANLWNHELCLRKGD